MAEARRVLVTGGTSPIGGAIVERLSGQGDHVVFTGRSAERGKPVADRTGALFVSGDIRDPDTIEKIVARAVDELGGLDGLVLAAGLLHRGRIGDTSDAAWDALLETNLVAPFLFAQRCMPALAETGGSIVAIASGTAQWTEMDLGAYSVSKRALLWLTQMLAVEAALQGVTVNAVCPGDTQPGMTVLTAESALAAAEGPLKPPLGRFATGEDIAAAVDFFLGPGAAFCTGASLMVDGGMRAALRASKVRA